MSLMKTPNEKFVDVMNNFSLGELAISHWGQSSLEQSVASGFKSTENVDLIGDGAIVPRTGLKLIFEKDFGADFTIDFSITTPQGEVYIFVDFFDASKTVGKILTGGVNADIKSFDIARSEITSKFKRPSITFIDSRMGYLLVTSGDLLKINKVDSDNITITTLSSPPGTTTAQDVAYIYSPAESKLSFTENFSGSITLNKCGVILEDPVFDPKQTPCRHHHNYASCITAQRQIYETNAAALVGVRYFGDGQRNSVFTDAVGSPSVTLTISPTQKLLNTATQEVYTGGTIEILHTRLQGGFHLSNLLQGSIKREIHSSTFSFPGNTRLDNISATPVKRNSSDAASLKVNGLSISNPTSAVSTMEAFGKTTFFKQRVVLINGENIIFSELGNYNNFPASNAIKFTLKSRILDLIEHLNVLIIAKEDGVWAFDLQVDANGNLVPVLKKLTSLVVIPDGLIQFGSDLYCVHQKGIRHLIAQEGTKSIAPQLSSNFTIQDIDISMHLNHIFVDQIISVNKSVQTNNAYIVLFFSNHAYKINFYRADRDDIDMLSLSRKPEFISAFKFTMPLFGISPCHVCYKHFYIKSDQKLHVLEHNFLDNVSNNIFHSKEHMLAMTKLGFLDDYKLIQPKVYGFAELKVEYAVNQAQNPNNTTYTLSISRLLKGLFSDITVGKTYLLTSENHSKDAVEVEIASIQGDTITLKGMNNSNARLENFVKYQLLDNKRVQILGEKLTITEADLSSYTQHKRVEAIAFNGFQEPYLTQYFVDSNTQQFEVMSFDCYFMCLGFKYESNFTVAPDYLGMQSSSVRAELTTWNTENLKYIFNNVNEFLDIKEYQNLSIGSFNFTQSIVGVSNNNSTLDGNAKVMNFKFPNGLFGAIARIMLIYN